MFLLLCWFARGLRVFLNESRFLRDHVWDSINDWIGNAKLLVDQLIGLGFIPGEEQEENELVCGAHCSK